MRLRQLREQAQLTQSQLGDKIDQTKSNISKYERGELEPNIQTLFALADFFGVTVDYLLGKSEKKFPDNSEDGNSNELMSDIDELTPENKEDLKKYLKLLKLKQKVDKNNDAEISDSLTENG